MDPSITSWRGIKTQLTGMDTNTLISLIHDLYTLNSANKEYLHGRLGGEAASASLRENGRNKIIQEFFPKRGFGKARITPVKKVISSYKKATGDHVGTADLTLLFIEQFVKYCREYGGAEEAKFDSLSIAIEELHKILVIYPELIEILEIEDRLIQVMNDASYIGYGIKDDISELIDDIEDLE